MTTRPIDSWKTAWSQLISEQSPYAVSTRPDGTKEFTNAPTTLLEAIQAGRSHGDKPFLKWLDQSYTFNEFFATADSLTECLKSRFGIEPGDRVGIAMRNRPEWMIAFVAIVQTGAVPVAINSWSTQDELLYAVEYAKLKLVFGDGKRCSQIGLAPQELQVINVDDDPANGRIHAWSELPLEPNGTPAFPEVKPEDPALILFTSGTTSRPKGVLSDNRAVGQALLTFEFQGAFAGMTSPERIKPIIESGLQPTALLAYPLFHVSGLHSQFLNALRTGRRLVILYKWDVEEALDTIRDEKITQFNGVPTMLHQLLAHPRFDSSDTDTLFSLGLGGGAASRSLLEKLLSIKPMAMSGTGYGMTEVNGFCAAHSGEQFMAFPDSCGWPLPILDVVIGQKPDEPVEQGSSGPIWVRSPTMMNGYWDRPEDTDAALQDGWLFTGDVGKFDAEGMLYITDRIKDIIIRGGENISAVEVEHCAAEHPAVEEAAVFKLPDEELGEAVGMVVYNPEELDEEELRAFMAERLASYKLPQRIWFTEYPLQRSATGKLQKAALKKEFAGL